MTERDERIGAVGFDLAEQPTLRRHACLVCGGEALTTITHRDRYGYPAASDLCRRCGVVFLNPVMTGEAYGRFYDGVYRPLVSAFHGRRIDARTIEGEQRVYADELLRFVRADAHLGEVRSILDIGGSTGVVAHAFAGALGARATVIDPAPPEVERARALGLETITALVEDWDAGDERYDLVLLCQTIDHLLDPRAVLAKVRDVIAPGGRFVVDIVDFRAGCLRAGSVQGATKVDHPYAFVEETVEWLLDATGLPVAGKEYAPDGLHVRYRCAPAPVPERHDPDPRIALALEREVRARLVGP